ncbi:MAG TPA: citryl-CoA lyase [Caulobacteraceae bacterium]
MKIGREEHKTTAISASNAEQIVVRGHDLVDQLIGRISFTDHVWLLVCGALPSEAQRRVLDSTLVAIAEHGLVPSVVASRMTLAASPEAMQGAVAAGLLGCGSVILGASENAGRFFAEVAEQRQAAGSGLDEAVREVIGRYRAVKRAVPGYGHPLHKGYDPRAKRLIEVCEEAGLAGQHIEIAWAVDRLLPELTGRNLRMNVSGAIPAVLLDAGYPLLALKGVPLLARTASLIAHLLEEQSRPIGFLMANAGAAAIGYDGEAPEGFTRDEN